MTLAHNTIIQPANIQSVYPCFSVTLALSHSHPLQLVECLRQDGVLCDDNNNSSVPRKKYDFH